ncbi:hypothetical protein ACP275_10G047800 [Erythranthe tilingii]
MITFMESKEKMKETEKCLDSQLWHACAGSMVQMPSVNSKVFYFPQGHSEHASGIVDFRTCPKIPSYIPSRVTAVKFMADPETDEVFAKIHLVPITGNEVVFDDHDVAAAGGGVGGGSENQEKPTSFAKTLTQSDANNGGGFSVPRYCAETIFPRLDYSSDPPVQTILAKDVHGETWKFRHIYRGTPRRHLLTTGWSTFVNHKKLVAGDSIVFMRAENGDLCVGIRRAKRGIGGGEAATGWNPAGGNPAVPYGGLSAFLREDEGKLSRNSNGDSISSGRVKPEAVIEAATLGASGRPFEVVYYPRASTPEFCVRASLVKAALQIRWCSGMRFKMPFETEDSSRISWFMGTISAVHVADPIRWPDSPWRLLQVAWDEPDLLQNVKRVSPWLVELVSSMPPIHHHNLSPFSPPRKKMRLPFDGQIPLPAFSGNPFGCIPNNNNNNTPAGMQGARHGLSLSDLFPAGFMPLNRVPLPSTTANNENVSCQLTMGNSNRGSKVSDNCKTAPFVLFGRPILTEKQISLSGCSSDTRTGNSSSDGNEGKMGNNSDEGFQSELDLETGHCKVFMESEDVGRTLDLSLLGSYEELYEKLGSMFGVEISEIMNRVIYRDATGAVRQIGDESFSDFLKTARRLRIVADTSKANVRV